MPGDIWSACIFNAMNNLQNVLPPSNFPSVYSLLYKILAISFISATNLVKLTSPSVLSLFPTPSFFSRRADSSAASVPHLSAHMFLPSMCITLQLKGSHHKTCMFLYFKFLKFYFMKSIYIYAVQHGAFVYVCIVSWLTYLSFHIYYNKNIKILLYYQF